MMIKVCGITNREDALAAVEAGASAIGLNFYKGSSRCVNAERAAEIAAGLDVLKVGVFVNEAPAEIARVSGIAGLDVVHLHGDETAAIANGLAGRVWKAFRITETWTADELDCFSAEAFLLDAPAGAAYGGSGDVFDWSRARGLRQRIILAGGLDATNVGAAIQAVKPWGVDACSRLEASPGRKDRDKMRRFVKAALAENLCI